jgi:hypothetical protein
MIDSSKSNGATRQLEPEVPSTEPIKQVVAQGLVSTRKETPEPVADTQDLTDANPAQPDEPIEVEILPPDTDSIKNNDVDSQKAGCLRQQIPKARRNSWRAASLRSRKKSKAHIAV